MKLVDLVGKKFGRFTVIERSTEHSSKEAYWHVACDCGNTRVVRGSALRSGNSKSCGCLLSEQTSARAAALRKQPWEASRNKLLLAYKTNANNRGRTFELTIEQCEVLFQSNCFYCGIEPSNTINNYLTKTGKVIYPKKKMTRNLRSATYRYNGIDRKNNNKNYSLDNCVPCCKFCNLAKHTLSDGEWHDWIVRICGFFENTKENRVEKTQPIAARQESSFKELVRKYKNSALRRGMDFFLTDEQCHSLFKTDCFYCGTKHINSKNRYLRKNGKSIGSVSFDRSEANYTFNGIDRKDNSLGYFLENCVSCCKVCNNAKGQMSLEEFVCALKRLAEYQTSST